MPLTEDTRSAEPARTAYDLGPLAWVLNELRKVLEGSAKTLRRVAREAQAARVAGTPVDAAPLAQALQPVPVQFQQSVGALEMVELSGAATLLRSMEAIAREFAGRPELCTQEAAATMERAGAALLEYLEAVLSGKTVTAVGLFPQYRDVAELGDGDKVHPADLWSFRWDWANPELDKSAPLDYGAAVRARLDQAVLNVVKSADKHAAREISELSLGLAATQHSERPSIFWQVSAGFFEAFALGLLPADLYVKRLASRLLMQYSALARGDDEVAPTLLRDMLFFCAQARLDSGVDAPVLKRVRQAFGIAAIAPVDYEQRHFGRFDAVLLAQVRKRIQAAAETWSAVAGGDVNRLRSAAEQFQQLADTMVQMQPESVEFARVLTRVVGDTQRSGRAPAPALAMEVATAVLYLQAAYEDLDQDDVRLSERLAHLAQRLQRVRSGGQPQPLERWMEELYSRVSDRRTMGSVVTEMKTSLDEVERLLDRYFRDSSDGGVLPAAATQLSQMRGVLSVLGLEHASQAVVQMRDSIDRLAAQPGSAAQQADSGYDKLGNNLGALGFLIDMLGYQPAMAKKLFVFDEARGELLPVMGRSTEDVAESDIESVDAAAHAQASSSVAAAEPVAAPQPEIVDAELLDIFLEEVREVVATGLASVRALGASRADNHEQVSLRRAFHTLKGSSRMVGLGAFGEAAWSLEQLHNTWLAEQKPTDAYFLQLSGDALTGLGRWARSIADGDASAWQAEPFQAAADALRLEGRQLDLRLPDTLEQEVFADESLSVLEPMAEPALSDRAEPPELALELESAPDAPAASELAEHIDFAEFTADGTDVAEPTPLGALPELEAVDATALDEQPADAQDALTAAVTEFEPAAAWEQPLEAVAAEAEPLLLSEQPIEEIVLEPWQPEDIEAELPTLSEAVEPVELSADSRADERIEAQATPAEATDAELLEFLDLNAPEPLPAADAPLDREEQTAQSADADELVDFAATPDDAFKNIDGLRVSIPLYNVYLGEADEWARRLQTEISEWALESGALLPDSTVALAHALGGSSSTVGFTALSALARKLEKALGHVQIVGRAGAPQAQTLVQAAGEVNRLLGQFAAGQLKEAEPQVLLALDDILQSKAMPQTGVPADADASHSVVPDTWHATEAAPIEAADSVAPEPAEAADPQPMVPDEELIEATLPAYVVAQQPATLQEASFEQPQRATVPQQLDDDIDAIDVVDPDLFPIFEEEATELLPRLGAALRQWVAQPEYTSARAEVMRILHTLKGSARLAGALRLGEMAHRLESQIERDGGSVDAPAASAQLEPLLGRFDALRSQFDAMCGVGIQDEPVAVPAAQADTAPSHAVQPAAVSAAATMAPRVGSQSVRVRAQLLDRLVNQAGEIMMTRARLESRVTQLRDSLGDLTSNLDRLRQQLRDVELQAETQMQSRLAQSKDSGAGFDPLEFDRFTRVQELTRMMAESVNDVATVQRSVQRQVEGAEDDLVAQARQSRELQRDLLRTRMVEFEGISERLYGVVRQAAKDTGKQVKLDINGGSIEMDRGMLDRLTPAFEHLLRNAVAHGVESPERRQAAGKPAAGAISIDLRQSGNEVSVAFRDDGAGLDLEQIRQKALERELPGAEQPLTTQQAAQFIFTPGFSTASTITELAGRGVGMDVVRAEVNALGGRIETESQTGAGTGFTLVLPLTTAVTQVVMLRAGEQTVGVPSAVVELVRRVPAAEVEAAYASGTMSYGGEDIPFFWCGALLQCSARSIEPAIKTRPVLIIRSASQRLALHVDEVLGNQEVVVKNLGPQLARLPGLAGMSVLPSGTVALIYNPVALATVYGAQARQWIEERAEGMPLSGGAREAAALAEPAQQAPLVLVVDDSITVRRVTQRLLQREGFRVALAADGLQAIERLAEELPVMVLSDIEMPRMDGFDLARNIRGDVRTADLPIVMITSRIGSKHREHAMELGVQHYLGKPYSEEELLRLARYYARVRTTADVD